jgi:hypothetical protein
MRSPALKRILHGASRPDYGKPTADLLKRYLKDRLASTPKRADLIGDMKLEFASKRVTYETLTNPTFQEGARKAYACGDFDKPFYEFDAVRATHKRFPL